MSETNYTGEEVLAMLEEYDVDPGDLREILQREQGERWQSVVSDLYLRIGSTDMAGRHQIVVAIDDVEILQHLVEMFAASEAALRDQVGLGATAMNDRLDEAFDVGWATAIGALNGDGPPRDIDVTPA